MNPREDAGVVAFWGEFDRAQLAMAVLDETGHIRRVNRALCTLAGRSADVLDAAHARALVDEGEEGSRAIAARLPAGALQPHEVRLASGDGTASWATVRCLPLRIDGEEPSPLHLLQLEDVTAQRREAHELQHRADHDDLTGLPNRRLFDERLDDALLGEEPVAVLFFDIDRFKTINDSLGHSAGDEVLAAIAPRLREALRPEDTLARFEGDAFVCLCCPVDGRREAEEIAGRLLLALREPVAVDEVELRLEASVGVALRTTRGPCDLVRDADAAMYRAKGQGGARIEVFESALREELTLRLRLENDLHRALERDELRLDFQPIVTLDGARIVGLEALMRWQHPSRGPIAPTVFIPLAEETTLIAELGTWAVAESCRRLARWVSEHPDREPPYVSINVSGRQLGRPTFVDEVADSVRDAGIDPGKLVLEVTETTLLGSSTSAVAVLEEIRAIGARVFLDDFGTGYSSLSHLRHLPVDGLKIDGSFAAGIGERDADAVVHAIIGLARALGLAVVAKGVETERQSERLAAMGCHVAQGYLFARPTSLRALDRLFERSLPPRGWVAPAVPDEAPDPVVAEDATPDGLIALGDAAAALGVSANTLRRWDAQGRITSERTAGGHRRFRTADVAALQRERGGRVLVRRPPLPAGGAPAAATVLRADAATVAGSVGASIYHDAGRGWWAGDEAVRLVTAWLTTLSRGCETGDFDPALKESVAVMRRAQLGGASPLECYLALNRLVQVVVRRLGQANVGRDETAVVAGALTATKYALLEQQDGG